MHFKKNWKPVVIRDFSLPSRTLTRSLPLAQLRSFNLIEEFLTQFIENTTGACRIRAVEMPIPAPRVKTCANIIYIMTHSNSNPSSLPKRIRSQFATYRIAISRVVVLTTFLVISLLALLPEVSRAQSAIICPPDSVPSPAQIGMDRLIRRNISQALPARYW
jgi:hypothetical protein